MLTIEAVSAWLRDHYGSPVADLTEIVGGEWSRAYSFRHDRMDYVARFSRLEEDFRKDELAYTLASSHIAIPRVVEIGAAFDGFYAISERAFGESLDALAEPAMRRVLPALFAVLDAARQVDLSHTTGYGIWGAAGVGRSISWRASLLDVATDGPTHRTSGWRARLAASPVGERPFNEAYGRLEALTARCPEIRHLVHADLLNNNVLVAGDQVAVVLDWGCALYGDFLYDLAWLTFWQPWYPAWQAIDFREEAVRHYAAIGLDVPQFAERLQAYEVHIGLANQGYSAFKGRWDKLEAVANRTRAFAQGRG
jgi:hygromycin-B 4-O-kinase